MIYRQGGEELVNRIRIAQSYLRTLENFRRDYKEIVKAVRVTPNGLKTRKGFPITYTSYAEDLEYFVQMERSKRFSIGNNISKVVQDTEKPEKPF